jgi:phosphoserine phosphatase
MDTLAQAVSTELGIHHYRAHHTFIYDANDYLDHFTILGDEQTTKLAQLQEICQEVGISVQECAAVGDGDNDLELFQATNHGITFKGSKLESQAWKAIDILEDLKNIF